ncbi:nucleotidyltransferase family protein [Streptomyces sp. NPDC002588]|uniref:nucleotidyltransferase family protein n=1 Tax=Streptomyces sp. NPDC002588 TaxID=3154419 RepID=UPI0033332AF8
MDHDVWQVLKLVARTQGLDQEPDDSAGLLRRKGFDHGRLVEQAMRQGLLAALADFVLRHDLRRALPARLRNPVATYLQVSKYRAARLTSEAARISAALTTAGLPAAWTKGVVLQSTLYDGTGTRTFNDIDLMIHPRERTTLPERLVDLGYTPDVTYHQPSGTLRPTSRASRRIYQLSPDHLPHFHRLGTDPVVPCIAVDVANSLTWHHSSWQVPMDDVLADLRAVDLGADTRLPALSSWHSFLFTCLHLFREGWTQRTAELKDVSLAQFADVLREWERASGPVRSRIARETAEHGLEQPLAWVCGHTDALFGTRITEELRLGGQATRRWLAAMLGSDGRIRQWSGDMEHRLRGPDTAL